MTRRIKTPDWKTVRIEKSPGCENIKEALNRYFPNCATAKYKITQEDVEQAAWSRYMSPKVLCIKVDRKNPDFETLYEKACKRVEEIDKPAQKAWEKGCMNWSRLTKEEDALYYEWAGLIGVLPAIRQAQNNPGKYFCVSWDSDYLGICPREVTDLESVKDRVLIGDPVEKY